jgi:gliding motility-associated protein GldM
MAHGKETPRQKMIGMMYLVLTAMLALNVSKEVLDAFTLVDAGLTTTTQNFAAENEGLYGRMNTEFQINPEKVGDWKTRADELKVRSNELYEFMNECKVEIVQIKDEDAIHDGEVHLGDVQVKDDTNTPGEIMIVGKKGSELKQHIEEYREFLLSMVDDKETYATTIDAIEGILSTEVPEVDLHTGSKKGVTPTWESTYFEYLPLASVITLLSKMQGDVRNVESEMMSYLLDQIDAGDFNVNVMEAVVIPNSSYVFEGQEYRAEIFVAAYDSTNVPEVKLSDGTQLEVQAGKGIFTSTSSRTGLKKWGGTIQIDNNGTIINKPFEAEYEVAKSTATVSATGMNVFYRGIKNPIEIAAGGVDVRSAVPRISSGSITPVSRDQGKYEVTPGPQGDKATINIYANIDGRQQFMGKSDFRVLPLPTPDAMVNGIRGSEGALSAGDLSRLRTVDAEAKDFVFEVEYEVVSFQVAFQGSGGIWSTMPSNSERFTTEQLQLFQRLKTGQRIMIERVRATGPDGVIRNLNGITITVR